MNVNRLLTTARVPFLVLALTSLASASVRMIVPTEGLTATGVTATGCISGEYWNCVNDPIGAHDGDASYVANAVANSTGSHQVTFNGTVMPAVGTNIRAVTMH